MNGKILAVLVVVSLILSAFNLVLLLRTNGITNIIEPINGIDPATAKADSFELKILEWGHGITITRNDADDFSKAYGNLTLIDVDEQTFLGEIPTYLPVEDPPTFNIIRCQDRFYGWIDLSTKTKSILWLRYTPSAPAGMSNQSKLDVFEPELQFCIYRTDATYREFENSTVFNEALASLPYNVSIVDVDKYTFLGSFPNLGWYRSIFRVQNTFYEDIGRNYKMELQSYTP